MVGVLLFSLTMLCRKKKKMTMSLGLSGAAKYGYVEWNHPKTTMSLRLSGTVSNPNYVSHMKKIIDNESKAEWRSKIKNMLNDIIQKRQ